MMSTALFIIATAIFVFGAVMYGAAKKGEQQTLAGALAFIAVVVAAIGALIKVAGG